MKKNVELIWRKLSQTDYLTVEIIREFLKDEEIISLYRKCYLFCKIKGFCSLENCKGFSSLNSHQQLVLNNVKKIDVNYLSPIISLKPEDKEELLNCLDYPLYNLVSSC